MGGCPIAVAERLCAGCDLLELPCWRGLSFACLRDCAAFAADAAGSSRTLSVREDDWARCEEVLGGAMGPVVAVLFMAGEFCVDAGSGCARGVVRFEECDTAGDW